MGERGAANEPATAADIEAMADDRRAGPAGRRARVLDVAHPDPPLEVRRARARHERRRRRAVRDRRGASPRRATACSSSRPTTSTCPTGEWPWMRELARRTGRTVSVNLNQPDSAPDLWRDVLGLLDEARADGIPIVAQVAGRSVGLLMCLEGSFNPLSFHPAYAAIAALPLDEQVAALRTPELRAARSRGRARRRRAVPQGRARQARPVVGGRRRRHRLRARSRRLDRCDRRRRTGVGSDGARHRPAARPRRPRHDPHPVLQLRVRRPRLHLRGAPPSRHPDGPGRRRRPLRRDLRRRHADVHAHPLDPRPDPWPEAPARTRRAPPDPPDRRALRPRRPRPDRSRACGPTSTSSTTSA